MKDVLVLVATGFEDSELVTTLNVMTKNEMTYELFSVENKEIVKGKLNAIVETKKIDDLNIDNYNALFIPGGPGYKILLNNENIKKIINSFNDKNKVIGAICAAPEILMQAGVVDGIKITSYDNMAKNGHNTGKEFEVSNNIVTGKNFEATLNFAKAFAKRYKNN